MKAQIDLTPFGFTPTETLAYGALLTGGPSSGYAIAKRLSIARANAYQALDGLVKKGAAVSTEDRPKRYRATRPDAILASIIHDQSRKLDSFEEQVARIPGGETNGTVTVEGIRALVDLTMRMVARAEGTIECLGPVSIISALSPAWRRRTADGRESIIWLVGDGEATAVELRGRIDIESVEELFGGSAFLLSGGDAVVAATVRADEVAGLWTSNPTIVGSVRGAIRNLTGEAALHRST